VIYGEKLSANVQVAESFSDNVKKYIEENKFNMDFVYNTDETGLNRKALSSKSLVSRREAAAS